LVEQVPHSDPTQNAVSLESIKALTYPVTLPKHYLNCKFLL
jgi:hypothetical protein